MASLIPNDPQHDTRIRGANPALCVIMAIALFTLIVSAPSYAAERMPETTGTHGAASSGTPSGDNTNPTGSGAQPPASDNTNVIPWADASYPNRLIVDPFPIPPGKRIGLSPNIRDCGILVPGEPDADYLLTDSSGTPLAIAAEYYLQSRLVSQKAVHARGQTLVRFNPNGSSGVFILYYGSRSGETTHHTVSKRDFKPVYSQLHMETAEIRSSDFVRPSRAGRGNGGRWTFPVTEKDYIALRKRARRKYGRGARPTIHDLENPYGTHDMYMSRYEGFLYLPEDGDVTFYMKADDGGLILLNGDPLLKQISSTIYSKTWAGENTIKVTKRGMHRGVYLLTAYQVEFSGDTQGLTLGWRTPSMGAASIVPPDAFVDYRPCEIRQAQGLDRASAEPVSIGHISPIVLERRWVNFKEHIAEIELTGTAQRAWISGRRFGRKWERVVNVPARVRINCDTDYDIVPVGTNGRRLESRRQTVSIPFNDQQSLWEDASLEITDAPVFLYADEPIKLYLTAIRKNGDLPSARVTCRLDNTLIGDYPVTWDGPTRASVRIAIPPDALSSGSSIDIALTAGNVPLDAVRFVVFNSRDPNLTAVIQDTNDAQQDKIGLIGGLDGLLGDVHSGGAKTAPDSHDTPRIGYRAVIRIPRENEADYRRGYVGRLTEKNARFCAGQWSVKLLGAAVPTDDGDNPIRNALRAASGNNLGTLDTVPIPDSHLIPDILKRDGPSLYNIAAAAAAHLPVNGWQSANYRVAVVYIGQFDTEQLTPEYEFTRAVDFIIDRLRLHGADRIVIVGPTPEPNRTRRAARYQKRLVTLCERHHVALIDTPAIWGSAPDFRAQFSVGGNPRVLTNTPHTNSFLWKKLAEAIVRAFTPIQ